MKVKELIKKLKKLDQSLDIVIASDDEGNSFRRLGYDPSEAFAIKDGREFDIKASEDVDDMDDDEKEDLVKVCIIG